MAIDGLNSVTGIDSSRLASVSSAAERPAQPAPEDTGETRFTPTSDLAALLGGVRQTAEVRQEVIGEVARRLASGELFTRQATESAVEGLLASNALQSF